MAKGRRLTSSRSDRLLGTGGYNYYDHDDMVSDVAEFGEDDVWSMVEDDEASDTNYNRRHNHHEWDSRATFENGRRRGGVMSQHEERRVGGLSFAFEDKAAPSSRRVLHQYGGGGMGGGAGGAFSGRNVASSAPVNVPDWSKILWVNSNSSESCVDSDDDDSGVEPPHEYLARSRKKMNAFSVFEGVGRTLKGRDMTRVRDAIWSQTGFEG